MRMFRAARSRWTYPMSERYLIPAAMPRSIPTSWMTVNWPSCFCSGDAAQRQVRRVTEARAAALVDIYDPPWPPEVVLTLRKASNEPFSMYSMTIITGLPANIQIARVVTFNQEKSFNVSESSGVILSCCFCWTLMSHLFFYNCTHMEKRAQG